MLIKGILFIFNKKLLTRLFDYKTSKRIKGISFKTVISYLLHDDFYNNYRKYCALLRVSHVKIGNEI